MPDDKWIFRTNILENMQAGTNKQKSIWISVSNHRVHFVVYIEGIDDGREAREV